MLILSTLEMKELVVELFIWNLFDFSIPFNFEQINKLL